MVLDNYLIVFCFIAALSLYLFPCQCNCPLQGHIESVGTRSLYPLFHHRARAECLEEMFLCLALAHNPDPQKIEIVFKYGPAESEQVGICI